MLLEAKKNLNSFRIIAVAPQIKYFLNSKHGTFLPFIGPYKRLVYFIFKLKISEIGSSIILAT